MRRRPRNAESRQPKPVARRGLLWAVGGVLVSLLILGACPDRSAVEGTVVDKQRVARHSRSFAGVRFVLVVDGPQGRRNIDVSEGAFRRIQVGTRVSRSARGKFTVEERPLVIDQRPANLPSP
jgi:hypothetical protein